MSMIQKIEIDGKQAPFKASAADSPYLPHQVSQGHLQRPGCARQSGGERRCGKLPPGYEMFENIAYVMAKHTDPSIPDSPEK